MGKDKYENDPLHQRNTEIIYYYFGIIIVALLCVGISLTFNPLANFVPVLNYFNVVGTITGILVYINPFINIVKIVKTNNEQVS